jgi:hypothetical protein
MPNFGVVRREPTGGGHVAFAAADRSAVDAFHEAATSAALPSPGVRAANTVTCRSRRFYDARTAAERGTDLEMKRPAGALHVTLASAGPVHLAEMR